MSEPPRLVPGWDFPPYSYVPGRFPHPISDPEGHSFGLRHQPAEAVTPDNWPSNRDYLFGIDLFNHGYYWEAHEVWEGLWHAAGREGIVADFLKGLIRLTAAGVKVRQGMPRGVASLARGAGELFRRVRQALGEEQSHFLGLDLGELLVFADELAADPERFGASESAAVERVLPLVLRHTQEDNEPEA